MLDGIPVTTPSRLVFDMFGAVHAKRAERLADTLWSRRLATFRTLTAVFDDLACRGRKGTVAMREYLEDRSADYIAPESGLEARAIQV